MIPQLPFGDDDFVHIQSHADWMYVDKTRHISGLFAPGRSRHLFLARPRRFGKTLLLSTVEALFQGRQDLFADTWIGQEGRWDWAGRTCPVLRLNLGGLRGIHDREELRAELRGLVDDQAGPQGIVLAPGSPARALRLLLAHMASAGDRKVVVLVDEYDTAITENLDCPDVLKDVLDTMRAFYGALKDSSDCIEHTLVTGILRLAHTGLFSGANHLADLSYRSEVNSLLGFTHAELREPGLAALVAQGASHLDCAPEDLYAALERQYNGYRFAAGREAVYNPYTLAGCLQELVIPGEAVRWNLDQLPSYWIRTGTPAMLLRGLQAHAPSDLHEPDMPDLRVLEEVNFDPSQPNVAALMYQTGYLTRGPEPDPQLVFPNREVETAFRGSLAQWWKEQRQVWLDSPAFQAAAQRRDALLDALERGDAEAVRNVLGSILATPSRDLQGWPPAVRQIANYEVHCQGLLVVLFSTMGLSVTREVPAGTGRVDLAVAWEGRGLFLMELKMGGGTEVGLRQAFARNYPALFQGRGLPVTVVGLQFTSRTGMLVTCRLHRLGRFDPTTARWDREPFDTPLAELHRMSATERQAYVRMASLQEAEVSSPPP